MHKRTPYKEGKIHNYFYLCINSCCKKHLAKICIIGVIMDMMIPGEKVPGMDLTILSSDSRLLGLAVYSCGWISGVRLPFIRNVPIQR